MDEKKITEMDKARQDSPREFAADSNHKGKKWVIIAGIAIALIAVIAGIGVYIYNTPANKITRHLSLGNRYLEEQNYEQAIVEFDKVIEIDPMSVDAYLGKAQAYEGMGDIDMAIQTLEKGYEQTEDKRIMEALRRLNPVIEWEDAALEALIREYLGQPEGDIYERDVRDIESLYIIGKYIIMPDEEITSLSYGIDGEYYFSSDKREIAEEYEKGKIGKLNDLRHFTSLTELWVYSNDIYDIGEGFGELQNLHSLQLGYDNISDISALSNLVSLTNLKLEENNISDISSLGNLVNLSTLYISEYYISDISVLGNLINLTELYFLSADFNDLSALNNLVNLTKLGINGSNMGNDIDVSVLGNLVNLTELSITGNHISDISALGNLVKLTYLWLWSDGISDISALGNLVNLTYLWLDANNISDISSLGSLVNLNTLVLNRNNISDISALGNLVNLNSLALEYNNISDISALGNLINLNSLGLAYNNISDISVLGNLTNLQSLYLWNNPITDYSPVSFVENLSY